MSINVQHIETEYSAIFWRNTFTDFEFVRTDWYDNINFRTTGE